MKISYNWVREFVELSLSPRDAADRLVNAGIEIASVTRVAPPGLSGVLVGEIEAIERELGESHGHRIVLCRVSTGRERFSVICGAPNAAVGVRAAFAPPGATLPGAAAGETRRVAVARIRGVESQGMLCSERELGLGDEHERGILTLPPDAPLGADLIGQLGLDDRTTSCGSSDTRFTRSTTRPCARPRSSCAAPGRARASAPSTARSESFTTPCA